MANQKLIGETMGTSMILCFSERPLYFTQRIIPQNKRIEASQGNSGLNYLIKKHKNIDVPIFIHFYIGGGVAFGPTDIVPGKMTVQGLGADIINLMKLGLIPNEDLLPIVGQLK
jgi:hypothetical protein